MLASPENQDPFPSSRLECLFPFAGFAGHQILSGWPCEPCAVGGQHRVSGGAAGKARVEGPFQGWDGSAGK